ncbi:hypothetical protein ACHAW5_004930 [Stephanodiscus triporus]|uniref:CWH43-like N-terminal domain-containing protein n=1 Tax=Stephanodiscus triporus TaxID=2934178 RepID=A0ABD3N7U0_9STRA
MGSTKVTRSQSTKKADPLLPISVEGKSGRCGGCGRLVLALIPMLGCSFIIVALYLLAYRPEVKITEISISECFSNHDPKGLVLAGISVGATLMSLASVMRNIQINVYHRRQRSESIAMKVLNFVAATCNIFAYVGFIILAVYDVDGSDDERRNHYVGATLYFALGGLYGLLHMYLLCKQTQYPMFCKIAFTMVSSAAILSSIIYASNLNENYAYEWFAVALNAIYVGLIGLLFVVDPVDDELRDFFCCHRGQRK